MSGDTIQVSSVKETTVTAVISEPCLWHDLDCRKGVFYSSLSGVGGPFTVCFFFSQRISGMKHKSDTNTHGLYKSHNRVFFFFKVM